MEEKQRLKTLRLSVELTSFYKDIVDDNIYSICGEMLLIAKAVNESVEVKILTPPKEKSIVGVWIKAYPDSYLHDLVEIAKLKLELYRIKENLDKDSKVQ